MTDATAVELSFPVLCLSRDTSISVAESRDRLHRSNAVAFFRNRYHQDLVIIDSAARMFRVVHAEAEALSLPQWLAVLLNRPLRVGLRLEPVSDGGLAAARRIVREWLDRAPEYWEASRELDEWRELIAGAGSARELVELFR